MFEAGSLDRFAIVSDDVTANFPSGYLCLEASYTKKPVGGQGNYLIMFLCSLYCDCLTIVQDDYVNHSSYYPS